MDQPSKTLIIGGLLLTLWGMSYGLYYALFDEHQTLERIGVSLTTGFARAAEKQMGPAQLALDGYAAAKFEYDREVDVHSHWSGLAVLLVLLGLAFDQVRFGEKARLILATLLVAGAFAFPFGVILQTFNRGMFPQGFAIVGSGLLIVALAAVATGFAIRGRD